MRRIFAASLIVILFINLFGYLISFTAQRYRIRAEVKRMLKEEKKKHTQQFAFTDTEYEQLPKHEGGREFSLNGGMYDVVKKERKGDKIILTAYFDHAETGLLHKLVSFFDAETTNSKSKQTIPSFTLLEFVAVNGEWKYYNPFSCFTLYPVCSNPLSSCWVDIVSPPPDLIFS